MNGSTRAPRIETFVARHARVRDAQIDVIRGLLYLATVTERIVNAVPDLCWHDDVARGQRTLANTLRAATTAYLALYGRQLVAGVRSVLERAVVVRLAGGGERLAPHRGAAAPGRRDRPLPVTSPLLFSNLPSLVILRMPNPDHPPVRTPPSQPTIGWTLWRIPSPLRLVAGLGAFSAFGYTAWVLRATLVASQGAPLLWQVQILSAECGPSLLLALGFALAAWGQPRTRRLGWALVGGILLFALLWTWHTVHAHALILGGAVLETVSLTGGLDEPTRHRLVEAAYRQYADPLFTFAASHGARHYHADASVAEDAVQHLFAALLAGQRDDALLRDPAGLKAHLYSAVEQRLYTVCRGEYRRMQYEAVALSTDLAPSVAEEYDAIELERHMHKRCWPPPRLAKRAPCSWCATVASRMPKRHRSWA